MQLTDLLKELSALLAQNGDCPILCRHDRTMIKLPIKKVHGIIANPKTGVEVVIEY